MNPDKGVLIGGVVIITVGFVNAAIKKQPETRVFAGGVGVMLIASLLSMAGGNAAKLSEAFMSLAVFTVLLTEAPAILQAINKPQGKPPTTQPKK